tara:strand:+ start:9816 stop:10268 length:453 start_codon:yes stop_codon:yes gene_type:complete
MFIYIGSDHGGFHLKKQLISHYNSNNTNSFIDCGTFNSDSIDYPDISYLVCEKILNDAKVGIYSFGILLCGTGIGMSISANKFKSIRAALIYDLNTATMSKKHNNANIICIGARTLNLEKAILLINKFMDTEFEGDRHIKRLNKIKFNNY